MRTASRNTITVTIYGNSIEHEVAFPARWIICEACDGHATTTSHVEADGGGLTASEFAEACHDDEDFEEKYFGGFYDRPCPVCAGRGSVQVIDHEQVNGWRNKTLLRVFKRQERESREIDAIHAAERRMGA